MLLSPTTTRCHHLAPGVPRTIRPCRANLAEDIAERVESEERLFEYLDNADRRYGSSHGCEPSSRQRPNIQRCRFPPVNLLIVLIGFPSREKVMVENV